MIENGTHRDPTADELAAIKAEALAHYPNAGDAAIASLLSRPTLTPNPTPRANVVPDTMTTNAFGIAMFAVYGKVLQLPADNALKGFFLAFFQYPGAMGLTSVPVKASGLQAVFSQLVGAGVVTQEELDALLSVPDPAWRPTVAGPSWTASNLGAGIRVEAADVTQARLAQALAGGEAN